MKKTATLANKTAMLAAALVLSLGTAGAAQAQTTTPAPATAPTAPATATPAPTGGTPGSTAGAPIVSGTGSATNNAVSTQPANNPGAPVPGANSFTEGQARDRIQDRGFSQVTDLKLDSQGVWRGKAMKGGQSVDVSMDYQGNVVPQ